MRRFFDDHSWWKFLDERMQTRSMECTTLNLSQVAEETTCISVSTIKRANPIFLIRKFPQHLVAPCRPYRRLVAPAAGSGNSSLFSDPENSTPRGGRWEHIVRASFGGGVHGHEVHSRHSVRRRAMHPPAEDAEVSGSAMASPPTKLSSLSERRFSE